MGLSPAGLIGSVRGSGAVTLSNAHVAGIDPAAFDAAIHATDQSGSVETPKIQAAVSAAMESGRLTVRRRRGADRQRAKSPGQDDPAGPKRRRAFARRPARSQQRGDRCAYDAVWTAGGECLDQGAATTGVDGEGPAHGTRDQTGCLGVGGLVDAARHRAADPAARIGSRRTGARKFSEPSVRPAIAIRPLHPGRHDAGIDDPGDPGRAGFRHARARPAGTEAPPAARKSVWTTAAPITEPRRRCRRPQQRRSRSRRAPTAQARGAPRRRHRRPWRIAPSDRSLLDMLFRSQNSAPPAAGRSSSRAADFRSHRSRWSALDNSQTRAHKFITHACFQPLDPAVI